LAADDAPPPRPVRTDADSGRQLDQVLRAAARRCLIRFDYKGRPESCIRSVSTADRRAGTSRGARSSRPP
ncbi:MAG: hypothetical protein ACXV4A_03405, partial [Actinomycetes bacterium]